MIAIISKNIMLISAFFDTVTSRVAKNLLAHLGQHGIEFS